MWLVNTSTLKLREFLPADRPEYAILSHRWGVDEISFKQFRKSHDSIKDLDGFVKIREACAFAKKRAWEWIWIDTCCIDKRSSADLSEAINSMFKWYAQSAECIVLLQDFERPSSGPKNERTVDVLGNCEWMKRGWTLQELIAPQWLVFCDRTWDVLGHIHKSGSRRATRAQAMDMGDSKSSKSGTLRLYGPSVLDVIAAVTEIPKHCLQRQWAFRHESVATRLSWAASRQTSREEDMAYCLLGLFDINMPLLYGEGIKAFRRLQEGIIQSTDDTTVFAWARKYSWTGALAISPEDFKGCGSVPRARLPGSGTHYMTNKGLFLDASSISLKAKVKPPGKNDAQGSRRKEYLVDMGWGKVLVEQYVQKDREVCLLRRVDMSQWNRLDHEDLEREWTVVLAICSQGQEPSRRCFYIEP